MPRSNGGGTSSSYGQGHWGQAEGRTRGVLKDLLNHLGGDEEVALAWDKFGDSVGASQDEGAHWMVVCHFKVEGAMTDAEDCTLGRSGGWRFQRRNE